MWLVGRPAERTRQAAGANSSTHAYLNLSWESCHECKEQANFGDE